MYDSGGIDGKTDIGGAKKTKNISELKCITYAHINQACVNTQNRQQFGEIIFFCSYDPMHQ